MQFGKLVWLFCVDWLHHSLRFQVQPLHTLLGHSFGNPTRVSPVGMPYVI